MRAKVYNHLLLRLFFFLSSLLIHFSHSAPSLAERNNNPLNIDRDLAPAPEDGPEFSKEDLGDSSYLPAQIGGIVGAYALSLIIVAALLLILAKKRREHLEGADLPEEIYEYRFSEPAFGDFSIPPVTPGGTARKVPYPLQTPKSPYKNFSYPSPENDEPKPYVFPSPLSVFSQTVFGRNPLVDQTVVAADRAMAQSQLEEMYKHVMEQEAAKEAGVTYTGPIGSMPKKPPTMFTEKPPSGVLSKKGRNKPAFLNLQQEPEKKESRASSILSALRSPRSKKTMRGVSISSPIMTPMSGTFPPQEGEEMGAIAPRQYAPLPPPPVPSGLGRRAVAPLTPPDLSPESTLSIDERLKALDTFSHSRNPSQAPTEPDPISAASENSTTPLVGLPASPRANRFPSLPASPRGATFTRPNAPSAVRTGGALPLRAYEPSLASPSFQQTRQTTFERAQPLSPSGQRTPFTGTAVPYSPYQPFTPCVPMTPSLVTREDRKRMKKMVPKTPTLEMVQSADDTW